MTLDKNVVLASTKAGNAGNQEWVVDFASDVMNGGRTFRVLSVVDSFTRECLALEVDTSMGSQRLTRVLDGLKHTARWVAASVLNPNNVE